MRHMMPGMWLHIDTEKQETIFPAVTPNEGEIAISPSRMRSSGAGKVLSSLNAVTEDESAEDAILENAEPEPDSPAVVEKKEGKAKMNALSLKSVAALPSGKPLIATSVQHDEDVFGLQLVPQESIDDLSYVNSCASIFRDFLEQFSASPPPLKGEIDLRAICKVLTDMIIFVTISDNLDPNTREGLPHLSRQLLLKDQQVLDLAIECVRVPFVEVYSFADFATERSRRKPENVAIHGMAVLAQRLARHILRECNANKTYAVRFVSLLQSQLTYGIMAAQTLTEVFADNEELLDQVDDDQILRFVSLLRNQARLARFVNFLIVLCQCNGKSVRPNQWRVCRLVCQDSPELLLKLTLKDKRLMVAGNPLTLSPAPAPAQPQP